MHFVQFCAQNQIQIYFGTILISKVLWWETKEYDQVVKVFKSWNQCCWTQFGSPAHFFVNLSSFARCLGTEVPSCHLNHSRSKSVSCWSQLSINIWLPVVYGRSVTVQRHRPCSNWKVWPTDLRSNLLTGIGSRDVYPSKNIKIIIIFILVLDFDISANKLLLSLCSILSSVVASWANHPHHYIILLIESPCPSLRGQHSRRAKSRGSKGSK